MNIFLTGHTGFKGAWMIAYLSAIGHKVHGFSETALEESLFERAGLNDLLVNDFRGDIRFTDQLKLALYKARPEIAIHLAAQAIVSRGYRDPGYTFDVNTNGTLRFLEATEGFANLRARLIITTDKVYRNDGRLHGYVESDPLGGLDPYSASKSSADLLTQSWIQAFPSIPTAIIRSGNVIGGGDHGEARLIPDIVRTLNSTDTIVLRNPKATRPWQHVLDCVHAYWLAVRRLAETKNHHIWNIGPNEESDTSVGRVTEEFLGHLDSRASVTHASASYYEHPALQLDSTRFRSESGWRPLLNLASSIEKTASWELTARGATGARRATLEQTSWFLGQVS